MFFLLPLLAALLPSTVSAHAIPLDIPLDIPLNETLESQHVLHKRQNNFFAVQGTTNSNRVLPRYEIRELKKRPDEWNMFLLAMQKLKSRPQSGPIGYFQIAGIHGVPRQNWDGVGRCGSCGNADGYCPHDSILFLGWHRAYLALIEQRVTGEARGVARKFPPGPYRDRMIAAAERLRFPFWDWAAHPTQTNVLPTIITDSFTTVNAPEGRRRILNPLFRHDFADNSVLVYSPFTTWRWTYRYPTSNTQGAVSDKRAAVNAMNNIRQSLQDQLFQMFSTCDEFIEAASNAQGQSSSRCSSSIEGIHNTIHVSVGGAGSNGVTGGHMTYLAVSSFDPIFWLHHCNVDRIFAMWQAIYPNSYSGSQIAPSGTWTVASGSQQNLDSPLTPFHRTSSGQFWTTNSVRDWRIFRYTYPEFTRTSGSPAAIQSVVNKLYGPDATAPAGSTRRRKRDVPADATPLVANNGSDWQYIANVQTPRYSLGASYWIYLFHDDPTLDDPAQWLTDPNLIGPIGVLSDENMADNMGDVTVVYSVPLTRRLTEEVEAGSLPSLDKATVIPYLKEHLKWRIVGKDSQVIDPATLTNFLVTVFQSTATPRKENELPNRLLSTTKLP